MNLTTNKSDCDLQVLNAQMVHLAEFDGVIQLHEHECAGFRFWHGVVDIVDAASVITAFEAGEHEDFKIRVLLPTGETGLTHKFFPHRSEAAVRSDHAGRREDYQTPNGVNITVERQNFAEGGCGRSLDDS